MARFIPESEHANSLTVLYRIMQVGDEARVLRDRETAYKLLRSAWYRHGRQEKMARGEEVPWLYLEPAVARVDGEVIEATFASDSRLVSVDRDCPSRTVSLSKGFFTTRKKTPLSASNVASNVSSRLATC